MKEEISYYVVRKKAVPEVLLKVVEAKRLLDSEKVMTVQEATERVGISRSSFYKYKDDIFPFHDHSRGRTFTVMIQLDDEPGLLSGLLNCVAEYQANILTIHQAIPVNGVASITLSLEILNTTGDVSKLIDALEETQGVHYLKILSRE
ncbi:MAG: ACT domain-containing protein [Frisingicoccus sp.]|uniref:ACT domain-containing protein n=1 Tax=Frisingicoccus sp. TaxID=1918627 RepID=UPI002A7F6CB7|nr:ACT domain-containing protein [Frisingicoccus sp.]MDY4835846.1 ACT domain-containing protein [Frisingicoccus sp.]